MQKDTSIKCWNQWQFLTFENDLENDIFQQNDAQPQVAVVTLQYFHNANVDILPWPARSPDLSTIEHV